MPLFKYRAVDRNGKSIEGTAEETSAPRLTAVLKERGLQVNAIEEVRKPHGFFRIKPRLTWEDIHLLNEQLLAIAKSRVPLAPSLKAIAADIHSRRLQSILDDTRTQLEMGRSLEEAFSRHPESFSPVYLGMIRAGERTGNLPGVLSHLCTYSSRMVQVKNNIQQAMMYPAVLLVAICAFTYFLLTRIVPALEGLLRTFGGGRLPWTMLFWLKLSEFFVNYGRLLVLCLVGAMFILPVVFKIASRIESLSRVLDKAKMRVPLFGRLYYAASVARFSRSLGLLLVSNVPVIESMFLAAAASGNAALRKAVDDAARLVEGGERISEALKGTKFFRHRFCWTLSNGETNGEVHRALLDLADTYETDITRMDKLVEIFAAPVAIVILGIIVGFFAMSIFSPLFKLSSLIR